MSRSQPSIPLSTYHQSVGKNGPNDQSDEAKVLRFMSPQLEQPDSLEQHLVHPAAKLVCCSTALAWQLCQNQDSNGRRGRPRALAMQALIMPNRCSQKSTIPGRNVLPSRLDGVHPRAARLTGNVGHVIQMSGSQKLQTLQRSLDTHEKGMKQ